MSASINAPLGHELLGSGPSHVVILNDWLCDTSTWDGARTYLDSSRFTFAFADLRGYGRSRGRAGAFTVLEAAGDVLAAPPSSDILSVGELRRELGVPEAGLAVELRRRLAAPGTTMNGFGA